MKKYLVYVIYNLDDNADLDCKGYVDTPEEAVKELRAIAEEMGDEIAFEYMTGEQAKMIDDDYEREYGYQAITEIPAQEDEE